MLCILFTLIMAGGTRNNTSALFCYTISLPRILHCWRSRIKRFIESKIFVSLIRFFFFFILFYYLECRIKIFLMISDVRSAIAPSICDCMWTYCKSKFRIKVNYKFVYIMLMLWVFRIDKGNINFILIKRTNCMCKNILKRKWHH